MMKALLRVLAISVGALLLALTLLAAYLAFVFNPNDYRDRLVARVEAQTGRELVIAGDIGLSVFPWLGVELAGVSLSDAPGFGERPFARVAQAQVRARLVPLLRGEVAVDRVVLAGLELNLVRNADGQNNWEEWLGGPDEAVRKRDAPSRSSGEVLGRVAAFAVSGVEVESGSLSFDDRQAGVRHRLHNLSLKSDEIRPGVAFPVELGLDIESNAPSMTARLDLSAQVLLSRDGSHASVDDLTLRFAGRGETLPGGVAQLDLSSALALDLAADTMTLSRVSLRAWGVQANGELHAVALSGEPRYTGSVHIVEFSPREVLAVLGQATPDTSDPAVLRRASLQGRVEGGANALMLKELEARIDDSVLVGEAGVGDLVRQSLRFNLALDAIDIDRYLPPRGDDPPAVATPGAVVAATADPGILRALDVVGRVRIGKLALRGIQANDIALDVRGANGVVHLTPRVENLYEGRYAGNIEVDARGPMMRVTMDEVLSGVQIEPLLRDLSRKQARLTGTAELSARLQATGNDGDALRRALGGDASFRFADGAVKGVNIAQLLREAEARLRGQPTPETGEPNQTDFTELSGTLKITDGVVRNDDLQARSPLLRVTGSGSADLGAESIDYRIRASVVGTLTGQGGRPLEDLRGVTVPIRVTGSFDSPAYALDVDSLITDSVKQQARERIEERLQKAVPEDMQEQLRRGLKGLLR